MIFYWRKWKKTTLSSIFGSGNDDDDYWRILKYSFGIRQALSGCWYLFVFWRYQCGQYLSDILAEKTGYDIPLSCQWRIVEAIRYMQWSYSAMTILLLCGYYSIGVEEMTHCEIPIPAVNDKWRYWYGCNDSTCNDIDTENEADAMTYREKWLNQMRLLTW